MLTPLIWLRKRYTPIVSIRRPWIALALVWTSSPVARTTASPRPPSLCISLAPAYTVKIHSRSWTVVAGEGACVSCHRVGDAGTKLCPDLSHIGRIRETRDLLEAIAFPTATIARGYETFSFSLQSGESLVGPIPSETAKELIVATSDERELPIARTAITKMEPIAASLMPAGLDRALAPADLADLGAFLRSLK